MDAFVHIGEPDTTCCYVSSLFKGHPDQEWIEWYRSSDIILLLSISSMAHLKSFISIGNWFLLMKLYDCLLLLHSNISNAFRLAGWVGVGLTDWDHSKDGGVCEVDGGKDERILFWIDSVNKRYIRKAPNYYFNTLLIVGVIIIAVRIWFRLFTATKIKPLQRDGNLNKFYRGHQVESNGGSHSYWIGGLLSFWGLFMYIYGLFSMYSGIRRSLFYKEVRDTSYI